MSTTTLTPAVPVSPSTNAAVSVSRTAGDLFNAAEQNPVVKADLQTMFDSYSHNPIIAGIVSLVGIELTQHNLTVDTQLLTIGVGLAVTFVGYAWQWISMKMNKPATPVTTGVTR